MRLAYCATFSLVLSAAISTWGQEPADLATLTTNLAAETAADRYAAADAIADLGSQAGEAVGALKQALASEDPELRWRAARALGAIGNPQGIPPLVKVTTDPYPLVRAQAIFALGRLRATEEAAVKAIVDRLTDKEPQVRRASVRALRMVNADRATLIPLVVKLLEDSDPSVVVPALQTIAEAGVEVVPALIAALEQPEARYWACLVLADMGPPAKDAVPGLVKAAADERPEVRLQAVIALGEIGEGAKPATAQVVKLLKDENLAIRHAAVYALGRIGDPAAAEALAELAMAEDPLLRMLAIWGQARLHPEDKARLNAAVESLVAGVVSEDQDTSQLAARALADLEVEPATVRPLVDRAVGDDPKLADRVMNAFASAGPRVVPHATRALQDPQRRVRALQLLARVGPEAATALPEVTELLKSEDINTKREALYVVAAIGPEAKSATAAVAELLGDADPQVQLAAAYTLGKIGPEARSAEEALRKLSASKDELLRLTAIWALLRVDPGRPELVEYAVPVLAEALKNEREFVRIEAATSLGDLGKAAIEALPALEEAARDRSAAVRGSAQAAIKKIRG